jgi:hypothetical protein
MQKEEEISITGDVGVQRALPPSGRHMAILHEIILLGTGDETWNGATKHQKKMVLGFELVNTKNEEDEGRPFIHRQEFTQSMSSGANIRLLLEGWKGEKFKDVDAKAFNFAKLIGSPCELNLIKITAKTSGKERIELDTILMVTEEQAAAMPGLKNETMIFVIPSHPSDFNMEKFNKIEKMYQNKIKKSDEYLALMKLNGGVDIATPGATATTQPAATVKKGNVPF